MSAATVLLLAPLTPLAGAVLMWLSRRRPNVREAVTLATAVVLFGLVASLYPEVAAGGRPKTEFGELLPGLVLAFEVEPLGMLFALVSSFLWIVTSLYSIGYMRGNNEAHQTRFYIYFALALAATVGIAFAANLLTLFVFYEALTIATYPLVAHHGTEEARAGGRTYLGILLGTSIGFFLLAVIVTWNVAGTLEFSPGGILAGKAPPWLVGVLLALYVFGIGKAAVMPFHRWLPAAMVAPVPVSALLHAVAVVKAGVFSVVKVVVYVFGLDLLAASPSPEWLVYVAGFTVIAASLIALRQNNLKLLLAYSTVSQLSYVILAAGLLSPLALVGAVLHIGAHALGKITLFFAAGSIYTAAHKTEVSQLDGIGRRMPWTMGAFAIGALSMIGLPPTAGFVSKWYMLLGALQVGNMVAVAIIIVSTLLNAAYFLPIVYAAFFKPEANPPAEPGPAHGRGRVALHGEGGDAPPPIVIALTVTATLTVLLFLFPGAALELAGQLVEKTR
ncbi:MAG: monovalent cation/H+ antiporter subunit D family protein [Proteobacteria bacterium]|nr:monovalent cation/H+ antiporter subunit D family protein [Pseudomonadota bacterium]